MVPGSSLGQVVTMGPDHCAGHSHWHNSYGSMTCLWTPTCPRWRLRPQALARPPESRGAIDINAGCLSCSSSLDQNLALGHSPVSDISWTMNKLGRLPQFILHYPHLFRSASLHSQWAILPTSFLTPTLYYLTTMLSNLPAPGSHVVLGWLLPTPAIGMLQPLPYPHAWA